MCRSSSPRCSSSPSPSCWPTWSSTWCRRRSTRASGCIDPMRWFGPRLKIRIGAVLVLGMCLMAIFAPLLAPHDPYVQNLLLRLRPPVWEDRG
ncbi:MAG: hypothetical protein AB7G10_28945, partial [Reyranellaceae bacterium]